MMNFVSMFFRKNACSNSMTLEQAKDRFPTFRYALVDFITNKPIYLSVYEITKEDVQNHFNRGGVMPVKVVDIWNEV